MGKNWAIAIGINSYDNLQPLKYAQRDAEVMATWFKEEANFDQIFLFTENSPPIPANPPIVTQPTNARFRRFLNFQFETPLLKPEDNLWFFFAGHGKRYNDQDYLMFPDSDPTDSTTAISVDYITQRLRRCGADNVVLLLDACRDEGSRGGLGIGEEKHQGVITFYSCTANQQSFEIDELRHGAFTHTLLEGLRLQGEANCATVERLARHLYQRVPQLNVYYNKEIQNPYLKADPPYKMYFILLRQAATFRDAQSLIDAAQTAELEGNLLLAENLWKRLWGLPGVDDRAFEAIKRIAQKPQQSSSNTNSRGTNSTGGRSVSPFELEEAERRRQLEAEKKRQKQADEELRRREQEAQKQRERQEAEARKQQQETERKRQQELDRQRKEQEAEIRRQQQDELWQNVQQFLFSRRQFLKWTGLSFAGIVVVNVIVNQLSTNIPNTKNDKDATAITTTLTKTLDLGGNVSLVGAGASFPAPLYQTWFRGLNKKFPTLQVNYQPIGSGAGVEQFIKGTLDFGASDVAMKDDEIAKVPADKGVILLPMTAGSIVLAYNLPDVPKLQLSRAVYTDILLGKIKSWDDAAIANVNPGAKLPKQPITVVYRFDGSDTTGVFTKHLSAISPDWKLKVGNGRTVNWFTGVGARGNEGVTAQIIHTPGSIGYIEYGYAKQNKVSFAALENKAGKYVIPDDKSASKTLESVTLPANMPAFITDPEGAESYPIVTYSWILTQKKYADAAKGKAVEAMIEYGLTEGQKVATELGYVPLPANVITKVAAAADQISPDYKISIVSK